MPDDQPPPIARPAFLFDPVFYLAANPDLAGLAAAPGFDPEAHFWAEGVWDGRDPSAAFSIAHLQRRLNGAGPAQALPLLFALPAAARPVPNAWFNPALFRRRYAAAYPEVAGRADYVLFEFYLANAGALALSPNGVFDEAGYQARNPDVAADVAQERVASGFQHFIATGWREGREGLPGLDGATARAAVLAPGVAASDLLPWFDADFYVAVHHDVHAALRDGAFLSALEHYLAVGREEGRVPHPGLVRPGLVHRADAFPVARLMSLADAVWLRDSVLARGWSTDAAALTEIIWDFVAAPALPGSFDAGAYLACNRDVADMVASGVFADAAAHWRAQGLAENRMAPFSAPFAGRRVSLRALGARPPGVNLVAALSLGDQARDVLAALAAADIAVYPIDVSGLVQDGARLDLVVPDALPHAITLFALPPDRILPLLGRYGADFFDRCVNVAVSVASRLACGDGAVDRQALGAFDLVLTADMGIAACTGRTVLPWAPADAKPRKSGAALRAILTEHCGFGGMLGRLGATLDTATPQGVTFGEHLDGTRLRDAMKALRAPRFSIVTPLGDGLDGLGATLLAQTSADWEWRIVGAGAASWAEADARVFAERGSRAAALSASRGEFLLFLDPGDRPEPDLLAAFAERLETADLVYCDGATPLPDFSPERLLAEPYFGRGFALRSSLLQAIGGLPADCGVHDLAMRAVAAGAVVAHVPRALLHAGPAPAAATNAATNAAPGAAPGAALGAAPGAGTEPGLLANTLRPRPRITVKRASALILSGCGTADGPDGPVLHVERFLRSILEQRPGVKLAIDIVVDRGNEARVAHLTRLDRAIRIVGFDAPARFNFAAKANHAVRAARDETVILLNDDMIALDADWAGALLEPLELPGVGATGARLLYPDRRIQHAGIALGSAQTTTLGSAQATTHIFAGLRSDDAAAARESLILRNVAAVTAACMAFRRADFAAIGGFDTRFAVDYNDTDFCLRLREAGRRVVYTPFATLLHLESQTVPRARADVLETRAFARRWGSLVARDPYHPMLKTA